MRRSGYKLVLILFVFLFFSTKVVLAQNSLGCGTTLVEKNLLSGTSLDANGWKGDINAFNLNNGELKYNLFPDFPFSENSNFSKKIYYKVESKNFIVEATVLRNNEDLNTYLILESLSSNSIGETSAIWTSFGLAKGFFDNDYRNRVKPLFSTYHNPNAPNDSYSDRVITLGDLFKMRFKLERIGNTINFYIKELLAGAGESSPNPNNYRLIRTETDYGIDSFSDQVIRFRVRYFGGAKSKGTLGFEDFILTTCVGDNTTTTPNPSITPNLSVTPNPSGTSTPTLAGDANGDGKVDLVDFAIWKSEFLKKVNTKTADFNNDKKVNKDDFKIWKAIYIVN